MLSFLHDVVLHSLIELAPILIVLFLTYLIMELVEDRLSEISITTLKSKSVVTNFIGALLGMFPTCAIPSIGVNLFISGLINIGTLVTIFLATSDEMLQILIASNTSLNMIILLITYKIIVATIIGVIVNIFYTEKFTKPSIADLCERDNCHCSEHNIIKSAVSHTALTSIFIFICLVTINSIIYFGVDTFIENMLKNDSILKYIFAGLVGLIPSCAPSIISTTLYCENVISAGTMLSCVFSTSGIGLILFARLQHQKRQTITIALILLLTSIIFGALFDVIGFINYI